MQKQNCFFKALDLMIAFNKVVLGRWPSMFCVLCCFIGMAPMAPLAACAEDAADLLEQVAKGDPAAQHKLGLNYALGNGVERDTRQAARWFRKAAEQGYAPAQFKLGKLYETGAGVPQSDLDACVYYFLAGEHEHQEQLFGTEGAAEVTASRKRTEARLSKEQLVIACERVGAARALAAVHPRKFGAPGLIGKSRGWWVWKSWNPKTWEAEVTPDPPGEVIKVRVLPWATTYRHQAYGARFDELLIGEKLNMFFDADEHHRRGYVVHFQDEISQMKGHGHAWRVREVLSPTKFVAQIYAGEKPLEEKSHEFEIDAMCQRWQAGKQVAEFTLRPDERVYLTWVYRDARRVVMLLSDDASLETLKQRESKRIADEVAAEGMAGQIETVSGYRVQFLVYSTYWSQAGKLQTGQTVQILATGPGYRPAEVLAEAKVVSHKNRGVYGSGVNDVLLQLTRAEDTNRLDGLDHQVLRLKPQ